MPKKRSNGAAPRGAAAPAKATPTSTRGGRTASGGGAKPVAQSKPTSSPPSSGSAKASTPRAHADSDRVDSAVSTPTAEGRDDAAMSDASSTPTAEGRDDAAMSDASSTPTTAASAGRRQRQNVVVCVRVRPAPEGATQNDAESLWRLDASARRISPTELHPSLAKRAPSSVVSASASSSFLSSPSSSALAAAAAAAGESAPTFEAYNFHFDCLLAPGAGVESLYASHVSPLVRAALAGYNATVFAYGQTGSGKTHTMSGDAADPGVIPRAVREVFEGVAEDTEREFLLRVSYLEIYSESLRDLLAPLPASAGGVLSSGNGTPRSTSPAKGGTTHVVPGLSLSPTSSSSSIASSSHGQQQQQQQPTLRIVETAGNKVQVVGLREEIVTRPESVLALLEAGQAHRHQAATDWNERSSRSHCVFTITVESRPRRAESEGEAEAEGGEGSSEGHGEVRVSQLNLIDLAGSERAASNTDRRKEGAFINKSLLTLGTVIAKLSEASTAASTGSGGADAVHIPYRDSKLTRLLQTSLGGNARVAVVCTMSAAREHAAESLSTLKFGRRCKMVVTDARRGSVVDDRALLARYKRELDRLRAQLEAGPNVGDAAAAAAAAVAPVAPAPVGGAAVAAETAAAQREQQLERLEEQRREAQRDVDAMAKKRESLRAQIEHLTRLILTGENVASSSTSSSSAASASAAKVKARGRFPRRSDAGPLSPTRGFFDDDDDSSTAAGSTTPFALGTPPLVGGSRFGGGDAASDAATTPSLSSVRKPFAVEAELATLRKQLGAALRSRQESESRRHQESAAWGARVRELEASVRSCERELDEAEVAFDRVRDERDEARRKAREAVEANRLLQLVAKSREARGGGDEGKTPDTADDAEGEKISEAEALQRVRDEAEERAATLRAELESLRAQLEVEAGLRRDAERELGELNRQRGQEDAERDFAQLVKGQQHDADAAKHLEEREAEVARREAEALRRLERAEEQEQSLAEQRNELMREQQEVRSRLVDAKAENDALQASLRSLQQGPGEAGVEVELLRELEAQRSRVASLERQLADSNGCKHKPLPVPTAASAGAPDSAGARRYDRFGVLVSGAADASGGAVGSRGLQRGGSVREYRRYSPSDAVPSRLRATAGDLSSSAAAAQDGRAATTTTTTTTTQQHAAIDAAVREERREIERLNAVIATQRAMLADLERSVGAWKARLKAQQDIIRRLVESNGDPAALEGAPLHAILASPNSAASPPPVASGDVADRRAAASGVLSASGRRSNAPSAVSFASSSQPKLRATTTGPNYGPSVYYGAHLYNRAPRHAGLSGPPPPKQASGWWGMPGCSPEPLPLPDWHGGAAGQNDRPDEDVASLAGGSKAKSSSSSSSSTARKSRRKTIDRDLALLRQSSRVESTKSRLLTDPSTASSYYPSSSSSSSSVSTMRASRSPMQTRRPLPQPDVAAGVGAGGGAREWYI